MYVVNRIDKNSYVKVLSYDKYYFIGDTNRCRMFYVCISWS